MQENNCLENLIEKIASFRPNIIIVDKIVSIKAQELLCKKKITVVYNVKSNILHKISRLSGGEIIDSIDAQISNPKFGECDSFYLKTFNNHTLMFIDGCKPDSGCTILLRGSIFKKELKKVKKNLRFLNFCDYNWKYEKAFLISSSACLTQTALNDFERYYEQSEKPKGDNQLIQQCSDVFVLNELNNFSNEDPLMNYEKNKCSNNSTVIAPENSILQQSSLRSDQLTEENRMFMSNFINDQVLGVSPFIYYKLPYLLTNESDKCLIKQFVLCKNLFSSTNFQEYVNLNKICLTVDDAPYKKEEIANEFKSEIHPFLVTDLKYGVNSEQAQTLRALYRSSDLIEISSQVHNQSEEEISEFVEESSTEPFNILIHQLLSILYFNYSLHTTQNPFCIQPLIMQMQFYVDHDFSLGSYLNRYCFTKNIKCECGNSNIEHISKFSHTYGSIYVRCKELNKTTKRLNSDDIITWSWCQICRSSSQSKIVAKEALSLSFGKFLQPKIYGNHFRRANCESSCINHSLFHDHFQYFAYQDMVASFKYYPVILREIVLPQSKLGLKLEISTYNQLKTELKEIHQLGFQKISEIFEKICAYQADCEQNNDLQFKVLFAAEVKNRYELKAKLDEIQDLLQAEQQQNLQFRLVIMNKIVLLKQIISSFVNTWNIKLNEYEVNRKKEDRLSAVARNAKFPRLHSVDVDQVSNSQITTNKLNVRVSDSYTRQNSDQHPIIREILEASVNADSNVSLNKNSRAKEDQAANMDVSKTNSIVSSKMSSLMNSREDLSDLLDDGDEKVDSIRTDQQNSLDGQNLVEKLKLPNKSSSNDSISSIVFASTPGMKAGLGGEIIFNSESDRENYEVVHSQTVLGYTDEKADQQKETNKTKDDYLETNNQMTSDKLEFKLNNLQVQSQALSLLRNQSVISQKKEPIRQSVKSLINNFLSGSNTFIIPDPFLSSQHYQLPMREKLPVVLDDNDVGSIIAYSLTTIDYERKLHELNSNLIIEKTKLNSQTGNHTLSTLINNNQTAQINHINSNTTQDVSNSLLSMSSGTINTKDIKDIQVNDNIDVQFNDTTTNYYCCVHFACQFKKLRSEVLDTSNQPISLTDFTSSEQLNENAFHFDTEEAFLRSISQTAVWTAKGGKSKASFSKTQNDRFVFKVVRNTDIQQFTQIAYSYFDYIHRTISECKPTLFAKIIGVCSVSWKESVNNTSMKKYVLVMENVSFDRKIKQKFDLKGSEKNRLASTKTSDDVLLDENLTKIIRDNPFYIRNHSKIVLQEAIDNDSKFLCDLNVIDYSLLVGKDEERKELVIGIIDYIQSYTGIKKLETVIKSMGKVMPTVIDPISYMSRFQNKMNQYFQCLPDQWYNSDII